MSSTHQYINASIHLPSTPQHFNTSTQTLHTAQKQEKMTLTDVLTTVLMYWCVDVREFVDDTVVLMFRGVLMCQLWRGGGLAG
jgi:hypothetical protein